MTDKTYSVAGTSSFNGSTKVRFANDLVSRTKTLIKKGHMDVVLIELGSEMTKVDICQVLLAHPQFQTEAQQSAVSEFFVRNCAGAAAEQELEVEVELESA
jgi:hypothetical protein